MREQKKAKAVEPEKKMVALKEEPENLGEEAFEASGTEEEASCGGIESEELEGEADSAEDDEEADDEAECIAADDEEATAGAEGGTESSMEARAASAEAFQCEAPAAEREPVFVHRHFSLRDIASRPNGSHVLIADPAGDVHRAEPLEIMGRRVLLVHGIPPGDYEHATFTDEPMG